MSNVKSVGVHRITRAMTLGLPELSSAASGLVRVRAAWLGTLARDGVSRPTKDFEGNWDKRTLRRSSLTR